MQISNTVKRAAPPKRNEQQKNATSDMRVVATVRKMIIDGKINPGEKITEVGIAAALGVSRTPARLALRMLEVEGFVSKRDGRGFTVNDIKLDDISKAYQVRGVLEGLAARLLAQKGLSNGESRRLEKSLAMSERALRCDLALDDRIDLYQQANSLFHDTIMHCCGNDFVPFTFARLESLPLLELGVLVFNRDATDREMVRLNVAHTQHMIIFDAIRRGDQVRAEAMMREHSNATVLYSELFVI